MRRHDGIVDEQRPSTTVVETTTEVGGSTGSTAPPTDPPTTAPASTLPPPTAAPTSAPTTVAPTAPPTTPAPPTTTSTTTSTTTTTTTTTTHLDDDDHDARHHHDEASTTTTTFPPEDVVDAAPPPDLDGGDTFDGDLDRDHHGGLTPDTRSRRSRSEIAVVSMATCRRTTVRWKASALLVGAAVLLTALSSWVARRSDTRDERQQALEVAASVAAVRIDAAVNRASTTLVARRCRARCRTTGRRDRRPGLPSRHPARVRPTRPAGIAGVCSGFGDPAIERAEALAAAASRDAGRPGVAVVAATLAFGGNGDRGGGPASRRPNGRAVAARAGPRRAGRHGAAVGRRRQHPARHRVRQRTLVDSRRARGRHQPDGGVDLGDRGPDRRRRGDHDRGRSRRWLTISAA